ncbi:potassium channel subfamily K member 16 [Magallana gigas]|nr:potassium channel subfamily K member 16 [Crassostrea gigas]|eukprot:XP_011444650.1 PREDICTED: potassium channel subfamily K member 16 [Crassostrea gigas]
MMTSDGPGWKRMVVLFVLVVVYLCVGAAIFSHIEGDPEIERRLQLEAFLKNFIGNHSCLDHEDLIGVLREVNQEFTFALNTLRNRTVYTQWDFTGAFSFVVTVVTTIGYGNLAPRTYPGKVALVVYALIGIPITLIMLNYLGQLLTRLSTRVNKCRLCSAKPLVNKVLNMVLIVMLGLTILFILPASAFSYFEDWTVLEALYYCFVTLSTIGFGDYIAAMSENSLGTRGLEDVYRVVTYVWILFGLAYLSLLINYISNVFIKKAEEMERLTKEKLEAEVSRLQQELSKTGKSVYKTAANVKSSVKGKVWEAPSNGIDQETGSVTLLRIAQLDES